MANFRRNLVPGGTYFFTVNLADRRLCLLTDHIEQLRSAFRYCRERHPFRIDAIVVLPEHLHAVLTLPAGDTDYSLRWRLIKASFSRSLPKCEGRAQSRVAKGERGIWQRRYWEHTVQDQRDYAHHLDYLHFNPVKHGHVKTVREWPYSSFHRFVRAGLYPDNWGGGTATDNGTFGERR